MWLPVILRLTSDTKLEELGTVKYAAVIRENSFFDNPQRDVIDSAVRTLQGRGKRPQSYR